MTKAIRKAPNNPALYLKRAELYRLHKEWQNSARDFGKARSIDPKLTIVDLGQLGKLLLDSGQFAKAKVALEIFLAKEPRSFEGNLTLARIYRQMKDISSSATLVCDSESHRKIPSRYISSGPISWRPWVISMEP